MSIVKVTVTHSASQRVVPEKAYGLAQTVQSIREDMYSRFGIPAEQIRLELYDARDCKVESNMKDEKLLGFYGCENGYRIHVVDLRPAAQVENFDDVSQVEKYEMTEGEWLKRPDNLRAFKERMLAQQRAEMAKAGVELPSGPDENSFKEAAEKMKPGDRCCCAPGERLGTVRYVGRVAALKPGYWVGVEFDEPVGKSDGTVKGVRLFTCNAMYGGVLRPDQVEVGDFPPETY
ncbi:putative tubulin-specific chaperone [Leptomonas pyrrhocoris]|uniref:Putative tubulin-specific chaperone n=1 Tax=Leptomonas pyrrhocoris TaxID=157538 RepID=A0A0N0DU73_LEPPY|nr:putative tubulin-specific chaperone [Leptomonas pyrrhocoris]XP_015656952.1 putative tubulin-specific chaperone [Leptomonas pyrrhocoris]KPA78512.1 putative tubulin-specific chaperone [Leptomonas pyrrhocoris]KPA78513.1 putative tubulin-specific chaperone [Leptomonas pyrrhocoris]|eukprot:XP_015656951.1 putative tubulin-specific chaperone [Leptomonas pyrrhocoris]